MGFLDDGRQSWRLRRRRALESFDLRHSFLNPSSHLVVKIIHASEEDRVHGREIPGLHSVVETDGAMILNLAKMST